MWGGLVSGVVAVWWYRAVACVFVKEWDLLKASEWKTAMPALSCPIATNLWHSGTTYPICFVFGDADDTFPRRCRSGWVMSNYWRFVDSLCLRAIAAGNYVTRYEYSCVCKSETLSKGFNLWWGQGSAWSGTQRAVLRLWIIHLRYSNIRDGSASGLFRVLWRCLVLGPLQNLKYKYNIFVWIGELSCEGHLVHILSLHNPSAVCSCVTL